MSASHCQYCLKATTVAFYHQPCSDYVSRLMLSPNPERRERGRRLVDLAVTYSTHRFMGRSD